MVNEIFNDMWNMICGSGRGIHTEGRFEEMAEIVVDAVVDDLIDNTDCDMEAKNMLLDIYSQRLQCQTL